MKPILRYTLIVAGVLAVYIAKVWASRTGFPLLTAAGYALIAGAILGLIAYVLRPAARTMPPRKFIGSAFFLLVFGIAAIAFDGEKKVRTSSAPVTNAVEPRASPSRDKELFAQVIHEFKDAFGRNEAGIEMWTNLLKANAEKQELETSRLAALKSLTSQQNEQCNRLKLLTDKTRMINNKEVQEKADKALALSIGRCKIVTETMELTFVSVSSGIIKATEGTVGSIWYSTMQVQKDELLEAKKRESEVFPLFVSALTALGMNLDLKSY